MAELLKGAPVAAALNEETKAKVSELVLKGIVPTLAILRVGEKEDDLSYERGAVKRCSSVGIEIKSISLPEDVDSNTFFSTLDGLNKNDQVHGILLLRPLPRHLDEERARQMIDSSKDVDGCTDGSLAGVFTGSGTGFAPCTAQAAIEILKFYGIGISGKRAAVIGRSLVIGRPVAMMLMSANATVTICHTRTENVASVTKEADIIVAASGQMESIDSSFLRDGQVVIDVGISWNSEKQKLCGDVLFEEAEQIVSAITPVPGGVGSVTTSILASHVAEAAARKYS